MGKAEGKQRNHEKGRGKTGRTIGKAEGKQGQSWDKQREKRGNRGKDRRKAGGIMGKPEGNRNHGKCRGKTVQSQVPEHTQVEE